LVVQEPAYSQIFLQLFSRISQMVAGRVSRRKEGAL
jgi:hypothetical protein